MEKKEKKTLSLLGLPKKLNNVGAPTSDFNLRDPFMSTMNDLIVFCLGELAKALHIVVVHTYENLPEEKRYTFYLTGYKPRSGWVNLQQKLYGDPISCVEGQQIKWLLKNLRWYWKRYAEYMELDEEAFDDITGFLLFDVVQNAYSDCETQMSNAEDEELVENCYQASLDLLIAIGESEHFKSIWDRVDKHRENLETMYNMITEFKAFQMRQEETHSDNVLDTSKVIKFLQNDALISELKREEMLDDSPIEKPITNFFLFSVIPRFEHLSLTPNDSGILSDTLESDTTQTVDANVIEIKSDTSDHLMNQEVDANMVVIKSDTSDPLANHKMDGSMIVINRYESTPLPKNKTVERKRRSVSKALKEKDADDDCDGSFVVI